MDIVNIKEVKYSCPVPNIIIDLIPYNLYFKI